MIAVLSVHTNWSANAHLVRDLHLPFILINLLSLLCDSYSDKRPDALILTVVFNLW